MRFFATHIVYNIIQGVSEENMIRLISKFVLKSKSRYKLKVKLDTEVSWITIKKIFSLEGNEILRKILKDDKKRTIMWAEKIGEK